MVEILGQEIMSAGRPLGPLTCLIMQVCDTPDGVTMKDIRAAIYRNSQQTAALVQFQIAAGRIFKAGVRAHLRYFLTKEHAEMFAEVAPIIHAERMAGYKARRLHQFTVYRHRKAKELRMERLKNPPAPPKTVKSQAEKTRKPRPSKMATTKMNASGLHLGGRKKTPHANPGAAVIWPEHVKPQEVPCGRDTRFTFDPPPGWRGQITQDWLDRRLQSV